MGMSSTKTKTKSTSSATPLDQYSPYITQGLTGAQSVLDKQQPQLAQIGSQANDVYQGLSAPAASLANIYSGNAPAQQTYAKLQNAGANNPSTALLTKFANGGTDPSMATLGTLAQGSKSPGSYDGIGSELSGMTNQQVNGDSSQFYKDTLSGKYLNGNPYIDQMAQQSMDAAQKSVNQRFAASGMGEGMSTPFAQAAGSSVADANNTLRYGAYKDELNRMGTIGGQSDSMYNATQDRSLSAATSLGQLQLGTQQAKDNSFNNDRNAQLAAAQSLGSQYLTGQQQQIGAAQSLGSQYNADNQTALAGANGSVQSTLSALSQVPGITQAQLAALSSSATLPFAGTAAYADLVNSLTAKYGNTASTGTSTSNQSLGSVAAGLAGSVAAGWASGGFKGI